MNKETFLEKVIAEINSSIKFVEAKNAALITLNSALIAWGAGIVFDIENIRFHRIIVAFSVLALSIPMIVAIISFCPVIKGNNEKVKAQAQKKLALSSPKRLMYYAYIAANYANDVDSYLTELKDMDSSKNNTAETALGHQAVDLAIVAFRKSRFFNIAVLIESIIFCFGGTITLAFLVFKLF